jgi:O-phospho-L-seryl-tRNASec:L-selenocysteinyl-tRNA synthase
MERCSNLLESIVNKNYVHQGIEGISSREKLLKTLLSERRIPMQGWDSITIEYVIQQLAMMDTNNFLGNVGLGEREGRVFSNIVSRRYYGLAHGIGRSGDIIETQPKAAGSSILYKVVNYMALHAHRISGISKIEACVVVPLATGMSLTLCLLTLKSTRPSAKYVIWPRIDQKSCFKSILTAGLIPIVVPNVLDGDELSTDTSRIDELLIQYGADVLCVLTTTSCFAPRRPDKIDIVAKSCKKYDVAHVVNNAYGFQCRIITKLIDRSCTVGRVDYVVQSTDKNFMVPVGGAIISSPSKENISKVSQMYPGRASSGPILDMFITLLQMGEGGLRALHEERIRLLPIFIDGMDAIAKRYGERILISPYNSISIGMTLSNSLFQYASGNPNIVGSMLFRRAVSGCRVVSCNDNKTIHSQQFLGWGSHIDTYHSSYITMACAVGVTENEILHFLNRFDNVLRVLTKSNISAVVSVLTNDTDCSDQKDNDVPVPGEPLSSLWLSTYHISKKSPSKL